MKELNQHSTVFIATLYVNITRGRDRINLKKEKLKNTLQGQIQTSDTNHSYFHHRPKAKCYAYESKDGTIYQ